MIGVLRIDRRKLVRFCVITAVLTFVVVGGTRLLFGVALKTEYAQGQGPGRHAGAEAAVACHGV